MSTDRERLEIAIATLETQRALLGDEVVDASLGALRAQLASIRASVGPEPSQQLKHVSILFLDVVGSTTLSQYLSPEELHAVMDGALARCAGVVDAHHGKVLQYAGDSMLAVFGGEETREDDAERAVRCGLALLTLARSLGKEVQASSGYDGFDVRVGVHTGGVLLGGGVNLEGTIRGIAVNVAARMEQTAPGGALRISQDTYSQVRGMFEVESQEVIQVKGVDHPVATYIVKRVRPRAFRIATRGIEGMATRMIGRDAELAVLQQAFEGLLEKRRLAALTVVAEAGVGKSRLLYEFEVWSEARPEKFLLFRGRAHPGTQGQPYGLLRDIIAWRLQIEDDDTLPAAQAKIERGIVPLFERDDGIDLAEGHAHLLGHLVGIDFGASRHLRGILDDAKQIRNRGIHVAAQMFRRISAGNALPIVLQLEDLHWADDASLDFLRYLAEVNRDVPMLILMFARQTLFERKAGWNIAEDLQQRLDLQALDKQASGALAFELLKRLESTPIELSELVTGGAEGNPFYMEELVKMLIDQGAIETHGPYSERWTLHTGKLLATRVPITLSGVLQSRLDGLPKLEKRALQGASVIGHVFWDRALSALDEEAGQTLPSLARRELVLPRPDAALDGLREFAFRHQILHQVTYDTLLRATKRDLHGRLAHWLSDLRGNRANDFLAVIAEHYEMAEDPVNASRYHLRSAEYAKSRSVHEALQHHALRGLALLDDSAVAPEDLLLLRWRLLQLLEDSYDVQGRRAEQRSQLDAMESLAGKLDDDRCRGVVALRRSALAMRVADWRASEAAARQTIALAMHVQDPDLRLSAQAQLAKALAGLGDLDAALALARQGTAEARERGLHLRESAFLGSTGFIANLQDDRVALLEVTRRKLAIDRETGNRVAEAATLGNLGLSWLNLGAFAQADRELEASLRLARANGDRFVECGTLCNLSNLALWQGDATRALALAVSAREAAVAVEARDFESSALLKLGHAELALGRDVAALQAYRQARCLAEEIADPVQHDALAGMARVALSQRDAVAGLAHLQGLLEHVRMGRTFEGADFPTLINLTCHQVLALAQDGRAREWLDRAHAQLRSQAAAISDAGLRETFLNEIPANREIVALWRDRQAG